MNTTKPPTNTDTPTSTPSPAHTAASPPVSLPDPPKNFRWSSFPCATLRIGAARVLRDGLRCNPCDAALQHNTDTALTKLGQAADRRRRHLTIEALGVGVARIFDERLQTAAAFFIVTMIILIVLLPAIQPVGRSTSDLTYIAVVFTLGAVAYYAASKAQHLIHRKSGRIALRSTSKLRLTAAAVNQHACPACHYPLEELNAIDPALTNNTPIGPTTCPECGLRWPLIPPPLDIHDPLLNLEPPATTSTHSTPTAPDQPAADAQP